MQTIFSFREKLNSFIDRRNQILRTIGKFLLTVIMMASLGNIFGSTETFGGKHIIFIIALACAFIPFSYTYLVFILLCLVYLSSYAADVIILFFITVLVFYGVYSRNFSKYGYIGLLTFILLPTPLAGVIPIFVGINCGVAAVPPMISGIAIYYFLTSINGGLKAFEIASTGTLLYQCVIDVMIENKEMIVCLVVMTVTAILAEQIVRMRFNYSWYVAVPVAAIVHAVLYLYGCFFFELSNSIPVIILSVLLSGTLMMVLQLYRGIIDYSRTENLQFEDDEYFYYVKAVPKVKVAEESVNVKTIARQQKSLNLFRDRNKDTNKQ